MPSTGLENVLYEKFTDQRLRKGLLQDVLTTSPVFLLVQFHPQANCAAEKRNEVQNCHKTCGQKKNHHLHIHCPMITFARVSTISNQVHFIEPSANRKKLAKKKVKSGLLKDLLNVNMPPGPIEDHIDSGRRSYIPAPKPKPRSRL